MTRRAREKLEGDITEIRKQVDELYKKGVRPNLYHFIIKSHAKFIRDYIIKLGFLDGWEGFSISLISAIGVYLKYQKLRMLIKKNS
jgi:hypothetical protein